MVVISNAITESNSSICEAGVEINEYRMVNKVSGKGALGSVLSYTNCIVVRVGDNAVLDGNVSAVNLSVAASVGCAVPVLSKNNSL